MKAVAISFAAALAVLLAACAAPEFSAPIRWSEGTVNAAGESSPDPLSVELHGDGTAALTDFPQGISAEMPSSGACLDLESGDRYSGSATWSSQNEHTFVLEFENSVIKINDLPARFGDQFWATLWFQTCGDDPTRWELTVECGVWTKNSRLEISVPEC